MKQLVNYKQTKNTIEDFVEVVLLDDREVLMDIPMCIIEFGKVYEKAYVPKNNQGVSQAIDKQELDQVFANTKIYHFEINESRVKEVKKDKADLSIRLPLDTKIDELVYENGQIFWAKPIEEKKEKGVEK